MGKNFGSHSYRFLHPSNAIYVAPAQICLRGLSDTLEEVSCSQLQRLHSTNSISEFYQLQLQLPNCIV